MINKMLTQHQSSPGFIDQIPLYRTSDYVLRRNIFIWSIKPGIDLIKILQWYITLEAILTLIIKKVSINIWNQGNNLIYICECS